MRAAVFAIAILMGGTAAVAQTTDTSTTEQTQTGWTATAATPAPTGGMVVQPSNAAPERDARGIPVISAPAVVPIGYNGTTGDAVGGPLVDPSTGQAVDTSTTMKPCTRSVTDHCLQTYERSRRR
jgi:hypothetical protein